jgi:UDP-N-acetylmuramoyl-L-alanyl-D-glutamate--2,6-diaminopimelate ligase
VTAALPVHRGTPFARLVEGLVEVPSRYDCHVLGLALDSRRVRAGDLFLALAGTVTDGRRFIDDALARGAVAVLEEASEPSLALRQGVPLLGVPGLSRRVGSIADRFFGRPSADLWVAGVTGTNGKTTVTHLIAQALQGTGGDPESGWPCGVIGTLGYGLFGQLAPGRHTTPDPVSLHALLAELRNRGVRHAVMEVSSHALSQGRTDGVAFDVGVFTNLTRDHLDYHGDVDRYAAAKRELFRVPGLGAAVVNLDDPVGRAIAGELPPGLTAFGFSLLGDARAPVRALGLEARSDGLRLAVRTPAGRGVVESPLLGRFNAANLLAALGALLALGLPLERALAGLGRGQAVPGRMERLGGAGPAPLVVVDYAHTPDALEQVLLTLREHARGALVCVFGCGGERDRGKRPEMGAVAERLADRVVLTDDNPRGEDGAAILRDILDGLHHPRRVRVERDRARAIAEAVRGAGGGDVVLIAGKGHEEYQEVAGERRPFSDVAVARAALVERGGGAG